MKKLIAILFILLLTVCSYAADTAKQVDFLLSGYRHPTTDQPLAGGYVKTYIDGTSTLSSLWTDKDKGASADNPFALDSQGLAEVYGDGLYKFEIYDGDPGSGGSLVETINGLTYRVSLTSSSSLNDDYGCDLPTALADIGSVNQTELIVDCDCIIASGTTVTSTDNISLRVVNGSVFDGVAGGGTETLIIDGPVSAGNYQIYGENLTVGTTSGSTGDTNPMHWGLVPYVTTSTQKLLNTSAIEKAIVFASTGKVTIPSGTYFIGVGEFDLATGPSTFEGSGNDTILNWDDTFTGTAFTITARNVRFANITLDKARRATAPANTVIALDIQEAHSYIENIRTSGSGSDDHYGWYTGIKVDFWSHTFLKNRILVDNLAIQSTGTNALNIVGGSYIVKFGAICALFQNDTALSITGADFEGLDQTGGSIYPAIGIFIERSGSDMDGFSITGSYIEHFGTAGIRVRGTATDPVEGGSITGNYLNISSAATGADGIDLDDVDSIVVNGNKFRGVDRGILLNDVVQNVDIGPNVYENATVEIGDGTTSLSGRIYYPGNGYYSYIGIPERKPIGTFTDSDTTPDISGYDEWKTASVGASITSIDGGSFEGQTVMIVFGSTGTTVNNGGNINLAGGVAWTSTGASNSIKLRYDGSTWRELWRR